MVRWFSESKSVKLPEEKVKVNYLYTTPYRLEEVQEAISESLTDFGEFGSEYLNVWLCRNDKETKDVHMRTLDISEYEYETKTPEILKNGSTARLVYDTEESQKLIKEAAKILQPTITREGLILGVDPTPSKKLFEPNLILSKWFLKADKRYKKSLAKHEESHKLQKDYGYFTPIQRVFNDIMYTAPSRPEYHVLFCVRTTCDDISANEVALDFGFKDDVLLISKHFLDNFKSKTREEIPPAYWGLSIFEISGLTIPFKNKNESNYVNKIRELTDDCLKEVKVVDVVSLRKDFEEMLGGIRNPIEASEIKSVHYSVIEKLRRIEEEQLRR